MHVPSSETLLLLYYVDFWFLTYVPCPIKTWFISTITPPLYHKDAAEGTKRRHPRPANSGALYTCDYCTSVKEVDALLHVCTPLPSFLKHLSAVTTKPTWGHFPYLQWATIHMLVQVHKSTVKWHFLMVNRMVKWEEDTCSLRYVETTDFHFSGIQVLRWSTYLVASFHFLEHVSVAVTNLFRSYFLSSLPTTIHLWS